MTLPLRLAYSLLQNRPLFKAICPGCFWVRDNRWLLSRIQRLAGPAGGQGPFVPVVATNRDKRGGLSSWLVAPTRIKSRADLLSQLEPPTGTKGGLLSWFLLSRLVAPTGKKLLGPLILFPFPPSEPFSSLVFSDFGSGEGSSCSFLLYICQDL
jgi:hypothetical protein